MLVLQQIKSLLTLITNALIKAAGRRSLYLKSIRHPPRRVAALLANVNWHKGGKKDNFSYNGTSKGLHVTQLYSCGVGGFNPYLILRALRLALDHKITHSHAYTIHMVYKTY